MAARRISIGCISPIAQYDRNYVPTWVELRSGDPISGEPDSITLLADRPSRFCGESARCVHVLLSHGVLRVHSGMYKRVLELGRTLPVTLKLISILISARVQDENYAAHL